MGARRRRADGVTEEQRTAIAQLHEWLTAHAVGAAHARRATAIQRALGFNDRTLRDLVHAAAAIGVLIGTGNGGYFLPASRAEIQATTGRLRSQAFLMLRRAHVLDRLAAQQFGGARVPTRRRTAAEPLPLFDGRALA